MNPFNLSASELMVWGLVIHLIADWPLQNDWMALNKMKRAGHGQYWWARHPAAYVHAGIHGILLAVIFGWAAVPIMWAHLIIDCRWIVVKWSELVGQTQPKNQKVVPYGHPFSFGAPVYEEEKYPFPVTYDPFPVTYDPFPVMYDVGLEVRFWTDQVFHIICIAVAAILVTA